MFNSSLILKCFKGLSLGRARLCLLIPGCFLVAVLCVSPSFAAPETKTPSAQKAKGSKKQKPAKVLSLGVGRLTLSPGRAHFPPFPASVEKVFVKSGDSVKKGQRLATLKRRDPSRDFGAFTLKANLSGNVGEISSRQGSDVPSNAPFLWIIPNGSLEGHISVSDKLISKIKVGDKVTAQLFRKQKDRQVEDAEITEIASEPIAGTGLFQVRFQIDKENGLNPWVGQLVKVHLPPESQKTKESK